MGLQTRGLVMVGLGVMNDVPFNETARKLEDGVHLRWAFERKMGFPLDGYFVFRRPHWEGTPVSLQSFTAGLSTGSLQKLWLKTPKGDLVSNRSLVLTDDFVTSGQVEFDLDKRRCVRYVLDEPARRVKVSIGFRQKCRIHISALFDGVPVANSTLAAPAGDIATITLEFDAINVVEIGSGPAALVDVSFILVSDAATDGWQVLADFPYPMCLPVFHPNYPCSSGSEDLSTARAIARRRIVYGHPDEFTSAPPPPMHADGTVSVKKGFPVVTGQATGWHDGLTGRLLHLNGDATGYTIANVLGTDRLVLSRPYDGVSRSNVAYEITNDVFGQLHDRLAHLVQTGKEMAALSTPIVTYAEGLAAVSQDPTVIVGKNTQWTSDLVGLTFRFTEEGEREYVIEDVIKPGELKLSRAYSGSTEFYADYEIFAPLVAAKPGASTPRMPRQRPLDLALLGALHPAMAQMLGLYWVDQTAEPGVAYDYLILADYDGRFGCDGTKALGCVREEGFANVRGYIVFNKKMEPADSLEPPKDPRIYALPGAYIPQPEQPVDAQHNVGLRWELGLSNGALLPGKAVMYHVWRTDHEAEPPTPPPEKDYGLVTKKSAGDEPAPILVTGPSGGQITQKSQPNEKPERPSDWPRFNLHFIDRCLKENRWYSYRVSGRDIFGRESLLSEPARWLQWQKDPDPAPWYYKPPPAGPVVHPFAIRLLDKRPPPPPTGVEAHILDPADPHVFQDEVYKAWRANNKDTVGLRVSWLWTPAHYQQAPDTREFRIYFQPGRLNALVGRTTTASVKGEESVVQTDVPNTVPAGAWRGATLSIGTDSFTVLDSYAGNKLKLKVKSGPVYKKGKIKVQEGGRAVDGINTQWDEKLRKHVRAGLKLKIGTEPAVYSVLNLDPAAQQLTLDRPYRGLLAGKQQSYTISGKLPRPNKPCTVAIPEQYVSGTVSVENGSTIVTGRNVKWSDELSGWSLRIAGEAKAYKIAQVGNWISEFDGSTQELTIDPAYEGDTGKKKNYAIIHPLFTDYNHPNKWQQRVHVVPYEQDFTETARVVQSVDERYLRGQKATAAGNVVKLVEKPEELDPDLSAIPTGEDALFPACLLLANDVARPNRIYRILAVDDNAKTVTVDGNPDTGGAASQWSIGLPVHRYEVFLDALTDQLKPSFANPMVYGHIGISAGDDKKHTQDDAKWGGDPDRFGNESPVAAPVTVFRVNREQPKPPKLPKDSEKVFATAADYHGRSYYAYRWGKPETGLKVHVYRALDDAVLKTDWLVRTTRKTLDPTVPRHKNLFPETNADDKAWGLADKQKAAYELNAIASENHYGALSKNALKVLSRLPGNEGAEDQDSLKAHDWEIRQTRSNLSANDTGYFPDDWKDPDNAANTLRRQDAAKRLNALVCMLSGTAATADEKVVTLDGAPDLTRVQPYRDSLWLADDKPSKDHPYRITVVDEAAFEVTLDGIPNLSGTSSAWALYLDDHRLPESLPETDSKHLTNDALRILAGLPGNARAFTQLTIQPLDPDDPGCANRRGPSDPDDFKVGDPDPLAAKSLRVYVDELDGRSTSRYFYRARCVDGAQNLGTWSHSSPPIHLPNVVPPRTPVITKVLGGDREITLKWASNREPDLKEYWIYRSDSAEAARDLRSMGDPVHKEPVPPGDPAAWPAEVDWTDKSVIGSHGFFYRIVAVDADNNVSVPSPTRIARAFDYSPPAPPTWLSAEWVKLDSTGEAHTWNEIVPGFMPGVALSWSSDQPNIKCLVQRTLLTDSFWAPISRWLASTASDSTSKQWSWSFCDRTVEPGNDYLYRLKLINPAGQTSLSDEKQPQPG